MFRKSTWEDAKDIPKCVEKHREHIRKMESIARQKLRTAQQCQKDYYDKNIAGEAFLEGEFVWLINTAVPKGARRKFFIKWSGPWKVVKVISDLTYRIQLFGKHGRRRVRKVVHFNRLKKCYLDVSLMGDERVVQETKKQLNREEILNRSNIVEMMLHMGCAGHHDK